MTIFDLAHRRKRKCSVIKAGNYGDLPSHLQRDIDRVKEKVNHTVKKKNSNSKRNLEQRIRNILIGKED